MKNRIVKKVLRIIFLVFVGVAVVGTFYFLWKKAQPVITLYELVTPARDTIETKTVATGKVEPRDEVLIKPQMSGIISELLKEAGQMVKEGEIIARIKVIPEMVQLNSAESRVRVAKINLEQISATFKSCINKGLSPKKITKHLLPTIKRRRKRQRTLRMLLRLSVKVSPNGLPLPVRHRFVLLSLV